MLLYSIVVDHEVDQFKARKFKCEHGRSFRLKSEDENEFNQIQIFTSSPATNCKLQFNGRNDEVVQILFDDDVQLMRSQINK